MLSKTNFLFTVFVVSAALSVSAFASDGTITINGSISANTCKVSGGGGGLNVTLDNNTVSTLSAPGNTAGFKPVTIKLTDCGDDKGAVKVGFEVGATTDIVSGRLNLIGAGADGVAKNVQVQLRNSDDSVIKIGDSSTIKGAAIVEKSATLNYLVGYYSTGVVTAGKVNTSVTYSIVYN